MSAKRNKSMPESKGVWTPCGFRKIIKGLILEIAHNKYRRCLSMAKWCFTKSNYHFVLARHGEDGKENNRKSILYSKWHKRWLEIAEYYKED